MNIGGWVYNAILFVYACFPFTLGSYVVNTTELFHVVKNLAFSKYLAYSVQTVTRKCHCVNNCSIDVHCAMYGGYLAHDTYYCSLYASIPFQLKVRPWPSNNSFLAVKTAAPGASYDSRDGYFYWMSTNLMNVSDARTLCSGMPGYRLGIYKEDIQVQILQEYYVIGGASGSSVLIGLRKNLQDTTASPIWDDGSTYQLTGAYANLIVDDGGTASPIYAYGVDYKINDLPANYVGFALCQGIPFFERLV